MRRDSRYALPACEMEPELAVPPSVMRVSPDDTRRADVLPLVEPNHVADQCDASLDDPPVRPPLPVDDIAADRTAHHQIRPSRHASNPARMIDAAHSLGAMSVAFRALISST